MDDKGKKETKSKPVEHKPTESKQVTKKQKKSHRKLFIFLGVFLSVFILIPLLIAGWLGFVPGLSNVMGARTPVDLGVTWTEADYQSYLDKTNSQMLDFANAPPKTDDPSKKTVFANPTTVSNQTFTQEELTAAINSVDWAWMPISNAQVRFTDNTVEISGNLELDNIEDFARFVGGVGYDQDSVHEAADWGRRLLGGAPIYLKANASVTNDNLSMSLQEVKIGRFSIPQDIANTVVYSGSTNSINNADNFAADSVTFTDGALQFSGTYPTTIYVLH